MKIHSVKNPVSNLLLKGWELTPLGHHDTPKKIGRPSAKRDMILTVNVVEPGLVRAVKLQSKILGRELKGLALVHKEYANQPGRPTDKTGLFKEVVCDFNNPDEIQRAIKPYADRLLAATCRYEEAIQPFSQVIPFLPFIHTPSETALLWSTEKPLMRDRLKVYDQSLVPRYQYMEAEDLPKLDHLVKDFEYPVIVKPTGLSKALLVTRCENKQELKKCLDKTFKIIRKVYDREQYPGRPGILVEEMMQGDMYSTDVYATHDGKIQCLPLVKVTTAHSVGLPGFYGYERTVPTGVSAKEEQKAFAAASSAIRALNLSSTTAHVEMFHTPHGWKIIEVAARIGGYRDILYREAYGIEHFSNDLAVRMGGEPVMPGKPISNVAVLNIYPEKEGQIIKIEGVEEAKSLPGIVLFLTNAGPGQEALFSSNGGNPVVEVILSDKDPQKLKEKIAQIRKLVKIHVEDK